MDEGEDTTAACPAGRTGLTNCLDKVTLWFYHNHHWDKEKWKTPSVLVATRLFTQRTVTSGVLSSWLRKN